MNEYPCVFQFNRPYLLFSLDKSQCTQGRKILDDSSFKYFRKAGLRLHTDPVGMVLFSQGTQHQCLLEEGAFEKNLCTLKPSLQMGACRTGGI